MKNQGNYLSDENFSSECAELVATLSERTGLQPEALREDVAELLGLVIGSGLLQSHGAEQYVFLKNFIRHHPEHFESTATIIRMFSRMKMLGATVWGALLPALRDLAIGRAGGAALAEMLEFLAGAGLCFERHDTQRKVAKALFNHARSDALDLLVSSKITHFYVLRKSLQVLIAARSGGGFSEGEFISKAACIIQRLGFIFSICSQLNSIHCSGFHNAKYENFYVGRLVEAVIDPRLIDDEDETEELFAALEACLDNFAVMVDAQLVQGVSFDDPEGELCWLFENIHLAQFIEEIIFTKNQMGDGPEDDHVSYVLRNSYQGPRAGCRSVLSALREASSVENLHHDWLKELCQMLKLLGKGGVLSLAVFMRLIRCICENPESSIFKECVKVIDFFNHAHVSVDLSFSEENFLRIFECRDFVRGMINLLSLADQQNPSWVEYFNHVVENAPFSSAIYAVIEEQSNNFSQRSGSAYLSVDWLCRFIVMVKQALRLDFAKKCFMEAHPQCAAQCDRDNYAECKGRPLMDVGLFKKIRGYWVSEVPQAGVSLFPRNAP